MKLTFVRGLYAGFIHCNAGTLTKLLRVMRLTSIILIVCCVHVSAKTVSQTVTYAGKNSSLDKVFSAVEKQTGYVFIYNPELIDKAKPVTVEAQKNAS